MKYLFQIKKPDGKWASVRPSGGKPYEYDTRAEAERMADICYPDQRREARLGGETTVRVIPKDDDSK